ncbi:MAG: aminotransferase class I/II-fold pyridoxal phosphate-dependent enzyme [Pseudomonadota bacterium]
MSRDRDPSRATLAVHAGNYLDPATGAVAPPVLPSTTFARDGDYELRGDYVYSRYHNPGDAQTERLLCQLEGGAEAKLFGSGLAAFAALFELVRPGQHVAAPAIMYHGGQAWLRRLAETRGIGLSLFDATDPNGLRDAIRPGETAIVWVETPVNPTWDVIDIAAAAEAAHGAGAILGVDATVATPVITRPLELGADIVFHSATKYLNGHSDLTAGVLVTKQADQRWEEIKQVRGLMGGVCGPFESWLLLRGLRTLFLRVERASANALAIAHHFESHAKLRAVLYPGLESHPGHEIAKRQMTGGFGGMLSLRVAGGAEEAKRVATSLQIFLPATSLGGVESLVEHRASIEGPLSQVTPDLLRLSVGIEPVEELIEDLERALEMI